MKKRCPVTVAKEVLQIVQGENERFLIDDPRVDSAAVSQWKTFYRNLVTKGISSTIGIMKKPFEDLIQLGKEVPDDLVEEYARKEVFILKDSRIIRKENSNTPLDSRLLGHLPTFVESVRQSRNSLHDHDIPLGRATRFDEQLVLIELDAGFLEHSDRRRLNTGIGSLSKGFYIRLNMAVHILFRLAQSVSSQSQYKNRGPIYRAMKILSDTPSKSFVDYIYSGILSVHDAIVLLTAENPSGLSEEDLIQKIIVNDLTNKLAKYMVFGQLNPMSRNHIYFSGLLTEECQIDPILIDAFNEQKKRDEIKDSSTNSIGKIFGYNQRGQLSPNKFYTDKKNNRFCPMTRTAVIRDLTVLIFELMDKLKLAHTS